MGKIPELLAPAGSMESLKAAVNAGADAIYLAGKSFGARHYSANFNDNELKEAVDFAHLNGVNVYVTVNTLIKDHELKKVAEYLIFLYKIGVDAILVQDTGVVELAKNIVPDLKLHASTQKTIHNLEGVKWASEMGFKRVVLSREMELSEIEEINQNISSKIELEIFAHGALCYSYSGQCLISSFIGGRSGNRGMCAQPCRRKYDLVYGEKDSYGRPIKLKTVPLKDKYLLSTRDLALYENLDKICKSSIHSLKIEGRMRSPEYVAIVVSIYRKALDSIKRGKWSPNKEDINNLKLVFSRDFTQGYILDGKYNKVMGRDLPGNRGIYIGSILNYNKGDRTALVEIKGDIIPQKGDGLVFTYEGEQDYGLILNKIPEVKNNIFKLKVKRPLNKGAKLYLTKRKSLLDKAQQIIGGNSKNQISADLHISIKNNGSILIKNKFNSINGRLKLEMTPEYKMEKALKKPLDEETIIKQFSKTGGTPFKIVNINIDYPGGLFAPIGELNRIRREMFEKMQTMAISSFKPSDDKIEKTYAKLDKFEKNDTTTFNSKSNKEIFLGAYVDSLNVLKASAEIGLTKIYFNPFNLYTVKCNSKDEINYEEQIRLIEEALSICKTNKTDLILKLPQINSDNFLNDINPFLVSLFKIGINKIMVGNIGAAKFILNLNSDINLFASSALNIWNHISINPLLDYFKSFTISPELSGKEVKYLASSIKQKNNETELELVVQGNMESLISKDCLPCLYEPVKDQDLFLGIRDIKNHVFPLKLDRECRTYVLNSVELSLIDYVPKITNMEINSIILDLQGRTEEYAAHICSIYNKVVDLDFNSKNQKNNLKKLKNDSKSIALGGITTGNFIRGITEE
ncbi:U32 family peptidase [Methanobacterium sp. ACI-7]|uniref:U32 family peptidase n=1 Tax=unclassified Methanobacterium TaxID=2627676 RepID=UPI0039C03DF3